jgi:N-sulfoglucosamine sulfohydrolase
MRLLVCIGLIVITASYSLAAEPKNVLLIIADDLGMQAGCYGDTIAKTPHLDALAASGTRFTNGFASVASCSPSRATILTGMPTHMNGQYGLAHADHNFHSFPKTKSLPSYLNAAGYRTGAIAKLHVQPKEVYPFAEVIPGGGGRNPVAIANAARAFIMASGDKPFFLLAGFTDPHRAAGPKNFANGQKYPATVPAERFDPASLPVPYHLPDTPEVRAELAEYYQSVTRLDHGIGLLLKLLNDTKKADNTLVIFISDNGIPFPGAKTTLYDSGVHLPLIVRKPGQKTGIVNDAMVSWTDLAPSILDWCGVPIPKTLPGKSFLPILETPQPAGWDAVYGSHQFHEVTMYYPMRMVRTRTHKLIVNLASNLEYPHASDLWGSDSWQGILRRKDTMMGQKSVAAFLRRPKEELYDLRSDPNELQNLASRLDMNDTIATLRKQLADWRTATNDPWLIKDKHE